MTTILKGILITPCVQIDNGAIAIDAGKITSAGPAKDIPGHTLSSYEEAKAGLDAGITHATLVIVKGKVDT